MSAAAALRARALAAAHAGDRATAASLFASAVAAAPGDAALLNSAGSFHATNGRQDLALDLYERALAADPRAGEAALNKGVTLLRLGRAADAAAWLRGCEPMLAADARYWSARAAAERAAGDRAAAAASYDRALALVPAHPRALHGRARVALERGEADAIARFEQATAAAADDAERWLGLAQALDHAGRVDEATALAEQLTARAPGWTDALELLAALRWAAGERDFCRHYRDAVAAAPEPATYLSWTKQLAGVDDAAGAAAIAAVARARFPDRPDFALVEAAHAGAAGDDARAEAIFATLSLATPERRVHEARHRLRRREFDRVEALLAAALDERPGDIVAWALRDLGWRLSGDDRHEWLHGQPGLVALMPLDLSAGEHAAAVALLDRLHDAAAPPVGQSVRDGTQTRGGLFDRTEPALDPLRAAIGRAVESYRAALPPVDADHPLLRHRAREWRLIGSWSIRLFGGGRHVEHIHSQGLASSAAYLVVPGGKETGALELGRSPPDLRLDLPPLRTIVPQPLTCALFPSTLYHGTRAFSAGKRMTVAFDVQAR